MRNLIKDFWRALFTAVVVAVFFRGAFATDILNRPDIRPFDDKANAVNITGQFGRELISAKEELRKAE